MCTVPCLYLQDQELALKEREAAVHRAQNEAEYARAEAEANLRSQKEESSSLARKLDALQEARSRSAREFDEREATIAEQARAPSSLTPACTEELR